MPTEHRWSQSSSRTHSLKKLCMTWHWPNSIPGRALEHPNTPLFRVPTKGRVLGPPNPKP